MAAFEDNFTEAADTALESHQPDIGVGWTLATGPASGVLVRANDAVAANAATQAVYLCDDLGSSDHKITITNLRQDYVVPKFTVAVRITDGDNYVGIAQNSWATVELFEVSDGTKTTFGAFGVASGDVITLEVSGSTATATLAGSTVATGTTTVPASSRAGFVVLGSNGNTVWDTFLHDVVTGSGDTTPPVLSNPSVTTGWKTADPQVDTDDTSSDVFCTIALATAPAPADGDAIIDGTYADAVSTVSATPSGNTVTLPQVTGLTPNTQYVAYFASRDAAPNTSAVVSSTFTTLSASMSATIGNGANLSALEYRVQDGASLVGADIKIGADASTDASGNLVINLDDVNVTDGQQVYYVIADAADTHIAGGVATVSIA